MKNASSAYRGAPMPGGRSFTQFRAARIRRVSFQWEQAAQADLQPAMPQPAVPHVKGPHVKGPHAKGPHAKGPHEKGRPGAHRGKGG
jgi:hypothetical protein